ncbi:MAG: ATP-binding cassette domain-containing protein, partial [Oscillospiraceae bacterium]|nr:ATP-binding cassette domain-containing protein [Oscillospiraceae bacterium]
MPGEKNAIENMNLSVEKGEFVGVIGHTGSGKSTLISHLNGLLKPTSGKVFINGRDIWA